MKTAFLVPALLVGTSVARAQSAITFAPPAPPRVDVHLSAATRASALDVARSRPTWARFASGTGNLIFLGAGTLLPLVEDGRQGTQHTLRVADSALTATLLTEALKRITRERRPDSNDRSSFPSGHATAAFAVATMQASFHPKQAIFWYAGATAIAASRVRLHRHYVHDVIAGAAVGILTSRLELRQPRGLIFTPFIHGNSRRDAVGGVSVGRTF